MKTTIKHLFFRRGIAPHRVKAGPFRGLVLDIDPADNLQVLLGLFEREVNRELCFLSRDLRSGVDVGGGSNGEYTLYFLRLPGVRRVFHFEPDRMCEASFKKNLQLNGFAVDSRLTSSTKFIGEIENDAQCTLDSLTGLVEPSLVKIDIEGGELAALRGAGALLKRDRVRWLIETHSQDLENACRGILLERGYETCVIENAWWRRFVPEQRPIDFNRWLIAAKPEDISL